MIGWFKIEGHSNPRHRVAFGAAKRNLDRRKRTAGKKGGTLPLASAQESELAITADRRRRESLFSIYRGPIVGVVLLTTLFWAGYPLYHAPAALDEGGVGRKMTALQQKTTGSPAFVSRETLNLTTARELIREENYRAAYTLLYENYQRSTFLPENYALLYELCRVLCAEDTAYCAEADKWQTIYDRLNKNQ